MARPKAVRGSPARAPGRPRDANVDAAIVAAAARQLGERGFAGMSVEGIAAAAGTTAPSLRRRYRGKLDLALAAIGSLRIELPPLERDPRADAVAVLENIRSIMLGRNSVATAATILAEEGRNPGLLEHFLRLHVQPRRERLFQALSRGVAAGQLRAAIDLDAAVDLLIGSCAASYLHHRLLLDGWAETTLAVIWPAGPDPGEPPSQQPGAAEPDRPGTPRLSRDRTPAGKPPAGMT
jgi:AcrR family transcriptional regulator